MSSMWLVADSPSQSMRTIRLLLVDDHQIMREGLASVLEDEPDIQVIAEADNGQQAIELARKHQPDVVVMDVTMPKMDGVEATHRILAELPQIRIIGLSIHQHADMAEAMKNAGAEAYLTKDGPSDDLIAAIRGA